MSPQRALVTRTWRLIALQTAALFAVGVLALDALAVGVVLDIARHDAVRQLDQAVNDPDALEFPPADVFVYQRGPAGMRASPGAPPGPIDPEGFSNPPRGDRTINTHDHEYLVRTRRTDATTVQVALDLTRQDQERHRLYVGLGAAGVAGILVAGALGTLIARRAVAPLGQAMARQRRFVADASHELRTPLTQLHMRAQLIAQQLRGQPDPQRLRDDVDHLVRGTRQMGEILDELLTAAELAAGPRRHEAVDLREVARAVVGAEQVRAAAQEVAIDLHTDGESFVVAGTTSALRRVFVSLVDNALHHTPSGGRITIELAANGSVIRAQVRDTGTGFDPAQSRQIFERFARGAHGDNRRFGIGLSLVHEVVTAHGGTITAESEPGVGSCFTVELPAWQQVDEG
ncbi:MAG TPA: HAMP domain-containing sensor histidine kinase [Micromonosporaceae bacterium]